MRRYAWLLLAVPLALFSLWAARNYLRTHEQHLPRLETVSFDQLRSNARRFQHIPRLPIVKSDDSLEAADDLLRGSWRIMGRPPAALGTDLTWREDPYSDRTWQLVLHTLSFVDSLLTAYEKTRDARYLKAAESQVVDWVRDNSWWIRKPPSEFSWNDHAVALRTLVLLRFWQVWIASPASSPDNGQLILRAIVGHARDLADPARYTYKHNHGIDQDIALLAVAASFPWLPESSRWRALAVGRLQEQLRATISPRGVHMEHSPSYQVAVLTHLAELYDFAREANVQPFSSADFETLLRNMAGVAVALSKPDGRVVPFGDSLPDHKPAESPIVRRFAAQSDAPSDLREDGYAIARSENLFLAVTAASNPGLAHKHADDLNFILYGCGRDLIVDHGVFSYNRTPLRRYFVGPYAHNTVIVDSPSPHGFVAVPHGRSRLTSIHTNGNVSVVQGRTDGHPRFTHERTFVLTGDTLFVIDRVAPVHFEAHPDGLPNHRFRLLLHLAPGLDAEQASNAVRAGPVEVRVHSAADHKVSVARGQEDPLLGWSSHGRGDVVESSVIVADATDSRATFLTEIRARCEPK